MYSLRKERNILEAIVVVRENELIFGKTKSSFFFVFVVLSPEQIEKQNKQLQWLIVQQTKKRTSSSSNNKESEEVLFSKQWARTQGTTGNKINVWFVNINLRRIIRNDSVSNILILLAPNLATKQTNDRANQWKKKKTRVQAARANA